jgi:hypothetical protein
MARPSPPAPWPRSPIGSLRSSPHFFSGACKPVKGFGDAGVLEIAEDDAAGTYRALYTVKVAEAAFVLHCFQKKSRIAPRKKTWTSFAPS